MEKFLPYDEETAKAITEEGKRIIRYLIKKFNRRFSFSYE